MRSICLVTIVTVTTGCPGADLSTATDAITNTAVMTTMASPGSTGHTGLAIRTCGQRAPSSCSWESCSQRTTRSSIAMSR